MKFAQHGGGKTTGQKPKYNNNGESHCLHCGSEYNWTKIVTISTSRRKGKFMPNLKMNNKNKNMTVTRLHSHRWTYIKSMATKMKKTVTISMTNGKK